MLGASVAGYLIEAVAGRGGMGVVYRARQVALDRPVALKLIAPELARDEGFRARFARESRIAASLDHPNVIPVYEAGDDGERLFIAMRFVEGTDLGRMLHEQGALEPRLAAELVAQAASALDAAHARSLVHRDVKPANLLVAGDASRPHVYLTDFGLARRDGTSTALTTTGQWMGTPDYAAPEQIDGFDVDARTDVYALGCVLFAALTGRPPFGDRPRLAKAAAHLHDTPPTLRSVRAELPLAFEPVVARALAKRPEDRYASAGDLGAAALAAAGEQGRTAATRRLLRRRGPRRPRWDMLLPVAGIVACGVLIAGLLGAFAGSSSSGSRHRSPTVARRVPPPLPAAVAPKGTVRCASTSCTQGGVRVIPPIEGASCGSDGKWTRIDADGKQPLFACSGGIPPAAVPDLRGARLDHAEKFLDGIGVDHDTSGGGAFGIIDHGNWTVCTTTPPAGAPLGSIKLFVDRSC